MKLPLFILLGLLALPVYGNDKLFEAINRGHKEQVKRILAQNIDVNIQDIDGNTPLIKAVEKGNEEIVNRLLIKGAKVEIANEKGETPLIAAAQKNNSAISKILINKKADVNAKTVTGETALFYYAEKGNKDMVLFLLSKKADTEIVDKKGDTALHRALHAGHRPVIQILFSKLDKTSSGGDKNAQLFVASFFGDDKKVEALLKLNVEAEQANSFGETPLIYAVKKRHVKVVKLLTDYGASGAKLSDQLYELIHSGRKDIAMLLIHAGADPKKHGHYGYTPLMAAVSSKDVELVNFLVEKGVDPNARDVEGYTALMFAGRGGKEEVVEALLSAPKIDVNQRNNHGHTALSNAVGAPKPSKRVVELLLEAGATPVVGNPGGKGDAISVAKKAKATQILQLLQDAGKNS